ncbi:MAG TPA: response regulator [Desulfuromonadales bacterium]|nr:response regulator [Desulfuromonadales bacterium]
MINTLRDHTSSMWSARVYYLLILVVMAVFAVSLTTYLTGRLEKRTEQELTKQVVLLEASMSSYHAALADSTVKLAAVFRSYFPATFSIDPAMSIIIAGKKSPLLRSGSTILNRNTEVVDRFTDVTKAFGTVFVRSGDDFIRVSTSLKKEDGSRAVGTLLERNHPAYQGLMLGVDYVGKAELFGNDYMTSYQSIKDDRGNVIAVLFIGLDFTDHLKGLIEKIRRIRIGQSGSIFILDAKGGASIIDSSDVEGATIVRAIGGKKEGITRYPWTTWKRGEAAPRDRLVAYRTFADWDWIICAGSWADELNSEAMLLLKATLVATVLVAVILMLLFKNMVRMEKRLTAEVQLQVDEYQKNQQELALTEEMLRAQIKEYHQTYDRLLISEANLQVQLNVVEESAQKFKAVFDTSPITVALTTVPKGTFYEVNQACIDMFGFARDEVIGKSPLDLGLWVLEEDHRNYLKMLREQGAVHNFEAQMRRKDGRIITALFSGSRVEIGGKPFILSTALEISEQQRLREQLQQVQKMEVVGQLAGGIAHDFNNMLAAILGTAEMLQRRLSGDEKNMKMIATILEAATRSADLTRDLLTFSRKQKTDSAPVHIHETIRSVITLLERTIDRRIELRTRFTAGDPVVIGDQTQLQNALLNLGINARDAMPEGGVLTFATALIVLDGEACLTPSFSFQAGSYLEISVSDNGCGMTDEVMEHVFEPFFTTKESGRGTGLGLAAVYGTVSAHAGEIRLQSQAGLGSVFNIYLPLAVAKTRTPSDSEAAIRGSGGILMVDDEEILRAISGEMLEDLGYTVYLAEDGQQALELYAAHRDEIHLVILDMIMPRLGGRETYLRLRESDPHLKVLFCSGFHGEGTAAELGELGACGFLQKPYSCSSLSKAVAAALAT